MGSKRESGLRFRRRSRPSVPVPATQSPCLASELIAIPCHLLGGPYQVGTGLLGTAVRSTSEPGEHRIRQKGSGALGRTQVNLATFPRFAVLNLPGRHPIPLWSCRRDHTQSCFSGILPLRSLGRLCEACRTDGVEAWFYVLR
ncbi:hypothetical protein H920_00123 [Fukomys damarensis]|uniref:Uncharacterized protein n=1 Tax=Fukomys damarensis TaxID=885580 RepID=A0A091E267_FUKDA|nr:hypothetical protein H920_00123 [Fukomys damarensis]